MGKIMDLKLRLTQIVNMEIDLVRAEEVRRVLRHISPFKERHTKASDIIIEVNRINQEIFLHRIPRQELKQLYIIS